MALHYLDWDGWAYDSDALFVGNTSGTNLMNAIYMAVEYDAILYRKYCTLICDYLGFDNPVDIVTWERDKSRRYADIVDVLENIEK